MTSGPATFASRVLAFNAALKLDARLPEGVSVMNPFRENACATPASTAFYNKYYDDSRERYIILGINPGRFGAGITGVPFTDPKRLAEFCGIRLPECPHAHEPSSEFVYDVVNACGGPEEFYAKWYINSICPLGFTRTGKNGRETNYNFYDSAALEKAVKPFIVQTMWQQLGFGIYRGACICFGTGKNAAFLEKLNGEYGFFDRIVPVEHPRYIMQYKYGQRRDYVKKYMEAFSSVTGL